MSVQDTMYTVLETITAFDVVTGDYLFTLDELQNATLAQSQDTVDITGKQGRKLSSLKRNKTITVSGNNGLVSGGLLALQTGGKLESKLTTVMWADYQTVNANKAVTEFKAVGNTGSEIQNLFIRNTDGTAGKMFTQGAAVAEGVFTYDPSTKAIAFNEDEVPDNTEIVIYYNRQIRASVLDNLSDHYSGKARLYIDCFSEDKCGNVYHEQYYIPKADFNGEFSFEIGENQTVHNFEATSEATAGCGANGQDGLLWTRVVFGENEEDAV